MSNQELKKTHEELKEAKEDLIRGQAVLEGQVGALASEKAELMAHILCLEGDMGVLRDGHNQQYRATKALEEEVRALLSDKEWSTPEEAVDLFGIKGDHVGVRQYQVPGGRDRSTAGVCGAVLWGLHRVHHTLSRCSPPSKGHSSKRRQNNQWRQDDLSDVLWWLGGEQAGKQASKQVGITRPQDQTRKPQCGAIQSGVWGRLAAGQRQDRTFKVRTSPTYIAA